MLLAQRDIEPEAWYALQLVHGLLGSLETDGLIAGDAEVELTSEGKALHSSLREYIAGPTVELLSRFDTGDIETTVRTLTAITQRAAKRLAASRQ